MPLKHGFQPVVSASRTPPNHHRLQKYVTSQAKPRDDTTPRSKMDMWDEEWETPKGQTIFESEPVPTGLLDEHGNDIYRLPGKIGFLICPS